MRHVNSKGVTPPMGRIMYFRKNKYVPAKRKMHSAGTVTRPTTMVEGPAYRFYTVPVRSITRSAGARAACRIDPLMIIPNLFERV